MIFDTTLTKVEQNLQNNPMEANITLGTFGNGVNWTYSDGLENSLKQFEITTGSINLDILEMPEIQKFWSCNLFITHSN